MAASGIGLWRLVCGLSGAVAIAVLASTACSGGVLTDSDLKKVSDIKPLFTRLMSDLTQSAQRTDLAGGDADCIKSVTRELMQISDELASYEYLITIESQLNASADSTTTRGIVKFAVDQTNTILAGERKRLVEVSDQCARYPFSYGKAQQALQFIDTTAGVLAAIQPRL